MRLRGEKDLGVWRIVKVTGFRGAVVHARNAVVFRVPTVCAHASWTRAPGGAVHPLAELGD